MGRSATKKKNHLQLFYVFFALCVVIQLYNINEQNEPLLLKNILIFTMSSTRFESVGSSSGRRLYVQLWYNLFTWQLLIPLHVLLVARYCIRT